MKHVIIGAGAAGLTAAKTIRSLRAEDEIVVVHPEKHLHARNRLVQYLSGEKTAAQINFVEADFFEKYHMEELSGMKAEKIDPRRRTVILSQGREESYDRLLLASGAVFVLPPIENLRQAGRVCGLRDLADADSILAQTEEGSRVIIIGSGLVGMDAAEALLRQKRRVTVVEMADRIIPLQLDSYGASLFQQDFVSRGASFVLGARVEKCLVDEMGNACGIELDGGRKMDCDLVVVAAGVRPNGVFAQDAVEVGRGVRVNERMQTSDPRIFAAGDVTGLTGTWLCAVEQGKTAGTNMAGGGALYQNKGPARNGLHYYGRTALSIGEMEPEGECSFYSRQDGENYQRAAVREGKLIGMLLIGDIRSGGAWAEIIRKGDPVPQGDALFSLVR